MDLVSGFEPSRVAALPTEWQIVEIGSLHPFITSGSRGWGTYYADHGSPFVRITNLTRESIHLDFADLRYVRLPEAVREGTRTELREHDVLISITADIGIIGCVTPDLPTPAYINQHLALVRLDPSMADGRFVAYYLAADRAQSVFRALTDTGAKAGMSLLTVNALKIPLPPLSEQRAIAATLTDMDGLVTALERIMEKKRWVRHAVAHQLLTCEVRLPGFDEGWDTKSLAQLGAFSKGKGIRKDQVIDEGLPCVRYGEIYTHHTDRVRRYNSFIPASVARESQRLRTGDLLFAGSGETAEEIGKCIAFIGDEEAYVGSDIVILSPSGHDPMFLAYLMNHESVNKQQARLAQGDAVVHISARALAQVDVRLPGIGEQRAIAAVLSDMDAEIEGSRLGRRRFEI